MPATKAKPTVHRPTCPTCTKRFRTTNKRQKYCKDSCREFNKAQGRRVRNKFDDALASPFFSYLAKQVRRAGTVRVVPKDFDLICEIHTVYATAHRANRFGQAQDYVIAHIFPVNGEGSRIGSLHPSNIVVASHSRNASHGDTYYGAGHSITAAHPTDTKYPVADSALKALGAYLGEELVLQLVKALSLKPSTRKVLEQWLKENIDSANPEHAEYIVTKGVKTPTLAQWKAAIQGKGYKQFSISSDRAFELDIMRGELKRLSAWNPELLDVVELLERSEGATMLDAQSDSICSILFNIAHGDAHRPYMGVLRHWADNVRTDAYGLLAVYTPAVTAGDFDSLPF